MRESTKRFLKMLKGCVFGNTVYGQVERFRSGYNPSSSDEMTIRLLDGEKITVYCEGHEWDGEISLCKERWIQPLSMRYGRNLKWRKIKMNQLVKVRIRNDFDLDYVQNGWYLRYYIKKIKNVKKAP